MAQQSTEVAHDPLGRVDTARGAAVNEHHPAPAKLGLTLLVAAVALGGTVIAGLGAWSWQGHDLTALLLLAFLAAVAERFDLSLYGDSRVSLAFVPIFSAILLFGLWGLAVVVTVAVVASAIGVDRPIHKTLFNFGALMLAGGASVLILRRFGATASADALPEVVGPAALAAAANFAINSVLVAVAIGLSTGHRAWSVWDEKFRWLWLHYLALGGLGLAIAVGYSAMGLWGIAVFLAPALMMRSSIKQYLDRTAKSVVELRKTHDELQGAHDELTSAMANLDRAYDGTLHALVAALDARDSDTGGHSQRVAELSMAMAGEMGVGQESKEWRDIQWGALLHDVGKIAVPDEILRKPAKLSDSEWETMRAHPDAGHQILRDVEFLAPAAEIVRAHHERYDGAGYPRGLRGEEILLGARIFSVADAFDSMTSDRPYRSALPLEEALAEIVRNSGTQFDPAVVRAFLSVYRERFLDDASSGYPQRSLKLAIEAILEKADVEMSP